MLAGLTREAARTAKRHSITWERMRRSATTASRRCGQGEPSPGADVAGGGAGVRVSHLCDPPFHEDRFQAHKVPVLPLHGWHP